MKLKASLKYQLHGYLLHAAIFYGAIILLTVFTGGGVATHGNVHVSMNSNDLASLIFLLVIGLNSVKDSFRFMTANGRTRRTVFCAIALGALVVSALMAAVDMLLAPVFSLIYERYGTIYDMLYGKAQGLWGILVEYAWRVALYGVVALSGVWISALYYRMNKAVRIATNVGVPVLAVYVLIMANIADGVAGKAIADVMRAVARAVVYMFGFSGVTPVPAMFCLWGTVLMLAAAGIFWVCFRRAQIKE